jgi:acyl-CoA hydrolase
MNVSHIDNAPLPGGKLSKREIAMQSDTNSHGDILAGG